jgi:hypothetical protein
MHAAASELRRWPLSDGHATGRSSHQPRSNAWCQQQGARCRCAVSRCGWAGVSQRAPVTSRGNDCAPILAGPVAHDHRYCTLNSHTSSCRERLLRLSGLPVRQSLLGLRPIAWRRRSTVLAVNSSSDREADVRRMVKQQRQLADESCAEGGLQSGLVGVPQGHSN